MARKALDFESFKAQFQPSLFDEYKVTLFLKDCAGGTPMNKDLIDGWINATCKEKSAEERARIVEATLEALPDIAEDKETRSWVGFKCDQEGFLYIEGRCVKSMLKEAGNIVKAICPNGGQQTGQNKGKKTGVTALKHKIADRVFIVEDRIYFIKGGQRIKRPKDGEETDETGSFFQEERPVHAMTAQGPRSSLKRSDVLRDVEVTFTIRRLATEDVPEETLMSCLVFAQFLGLGADRSQGKGTMKDIQVERTKEAAVAA